MAAQVYTLNTCRGLRRPARVCVCVKCARLPESEGVCLSAGESQLGPASLSDMRYERRIRAPATDSGASGPGLVREESMSGAAGGRM